MIKPINERGSPVLYNTTIPVAPIVQLKKETTSLTAANTEELLPEGMMQTVKWQPHIIQLVADLIDTAESMAERCLGLAATQIWDGDPNECPSIFVMRWPKKESKRNWDWAEFINPMIKTSGKTLKLEEGCLSYPGLVVKKARSANITLVYQSLFEPRQRTFKLTRNQHRELPHIIQHEIDHLNGKCVRSPNFKG